MASDPTQMSIGALLTSCNMVATTGLTRAEKLSRLTGLPIGKCLVLLDCITEEELRAALEAQSMARDGIFENSQVTAALDIVRRRKWPLADALLSLGCDAHLTRRTRLGELLSDAQAISQFQLNFALQAADFSSIPLGRVLTSFNKYDNDLVNSALRLQSEIRKGDVDRSQAVEELSTLARDKPESIKEEPHCKIGELLCDAQIIDRSAADLAMRAAAGQNILIGEYMVNNGIVVESALLAALCLQNLLDASLISSTGASLLLRNIGQILPGATSGPINLFDFLRASGYLTVERRKELMEAMAAKLDRNIAEIKRQLEDPASLSKYLLELFPKDAGIINSGVVLHQLVLTGKMTSTQAVLAFGFRHKQIA